MKDLKLNNKLILPIVLLIGIGIGFYINEGEGHKEVAQEEAQSNTLWTCSMHPQIRQANAGQCPLCGMDLIPMLENEDATDLAEIKMSATAMQLGDVQTSIVKQQLPEKAIQMNGKVKVDERLMLSQSSHIPGRVERLMVSFTGEAIEKGQVLAEVYSPDLVTAQEELFEAYKVRGEQPDLYAASRSKFANWKLSDEQIEQIISRGEPQSIFPVLADYSGVVLKKSVHVGDYIKKGQPLMQVANLDKVWILLDVYESDLAWVKKGSMVDFSVQSIPGKNFQSKISFIDPVIDPKKRVAHVRLEVDNLDAALKPDMFVKGTAKSQLKKYKASLVIPKSAVMWTGSRSLVYKRRSDAKGVYFKMHEIVLGPSLGDSYLVHDGLEEGDEIATSGTFSIDAAAQLAGKPSMMSLDKVDHKPTEKISLSRNATVSIVGLLNAYDKIKEALANDDFEATKEATLLFQKEFQKINMSLFKGDAHDVWMNASSSIKAASQSMINKEDIKGVRSPFTELSNAIIEIVKGFGPFNNDLYIQYCSMANNNDGGYWLSKDKAIKNPYYGAMMLKCGELKETIKK